MASGRCGVSGFDDAGLAAIVFVPPVVSPDTDCLVVPSLCDMTFGWRDFDDAALGQEVKLASSC